MVVCVQYDIQYNMPLIQRVTELETWLIYFANGCSPPAESSPRTECTVTHRDHLYTLWARSGSRVSLHVLCKPTSAVVFTEDIITCSHVGEHEASFFSVLLQRDYILSINQVC